MALKLRIKFGRLVLSDLTKVMWYRHMDRQTEQAEFKSKYKVIWITAFQHRQQNNWMWKEKSLQKWAKATEYPCRKKSILTWPRIIHNYSKQDHRVESKLLSYEVFRRNHKRISLWLWKGKDFLVHRKQKLKIINFH